VKLIARSLALLGAILVTPAFRLMVECLEDLERVMRTISDVA